MKTFLLTIGIILVISFNAFAQVSVTATSGTLGPSNYTNLRLAFNAINNGTHKGVITISITSSPAADNNTATLNASGSGSASYSSIAISPSGGAARTISGNRVGALIDFSGATNVTIDGLNSGGNSLTISNTSIASSATTIRFINGASNNTITKCTLLGSSASVSTDANGRGIITFNTSSGASGNNYNTISYNNITHANTDAYRPTNVVYSYGTSGKENTGNIIINNNIYDFFSRDYESNGINIAHYSTTWTISGNSFYETTSFAPTANVEYKAIKISGSPGNSYNVSNNYIGGSAVTCGGSA